MSVPDLADLRDALARAAAAAGAELSANNFLQAEASPVAEAVGDAIRLAELAACASALDAHHMASAAYGRASRALLQRADAPGVWDALGELRQHLIALEALTKNLPCLEDEIALPRELIIERSGIGGELTAFDARLDALTDASTTLAALKQRTGGWERQDKIIDYVAARLDANATLARILCKESSVDIIAMSRSAEAIGSISEAFEATIGHPVAKIAKPLAVFAPRLAGAAAAVRAAGRRLSRRALTVLGDLGLSKSTGAPDESDLRELIRDVSRQDFRAPPRAMVLLEHDAEETRFVSELACHLILEGLGVGFADFPDIELGDLMSAMLVERLRATGWLLNYEPGAAGIGAKMRVRQHGVRRFLVVLATPNYVDDVLALETWGKSQIRAAGTSDEFRAGIRNRVVVYAQDGVDVFRYDILKQSFGVTGERVIQAQARNAEHAAQQIDAALSELPSWSS